MGSEFLSSQLSEKLHINKSRAGICLPCAPPTSLDTATVCLTGQWEVPWATWSSCQVETTKGQRECLSQLISPQNLPPISGDYTDSPWDYESQVLMKSFLRNHKKKVCHFSQWIKQNHFERLYPAEGKRKKGNYPNRALKIFSQFLKQNSKQYLCSRAH